MMAFVSGGTVDFRELGIYVLPNGRELVFILRGNCQALISLDSAQRMGAPQYELNNNGRLVCEGRLTAWDISNLSDTGRTINA